MIRVPTHRHPAHPGEVLLEDFLKPHGMTQVHLAERIGVPFQRVNQIVKGRRGITPDTALRLGRLFNTTPDIWLNLQLAVDLYDALHAQNARAIDEIRPLAVSKAV
ncbi:MAG: HigA family addiction module antitoxin [Gemmatimonadaceae bacterium]